MHDRAMQTLFYLALEPIAETTADNVSFGFRRDRSAKDACEQAFNVLSRKCSPVWILEGDIKGCFDNINHEWLINNILMNKRIMRQFLNAGYIYKNKLFPTNTGSPQGGAISSLYANMALDGLEKVIHDRYYRNSKGKITNYYRAKTKINLIKYADDFIITANTKEIAEELQNIVREFLKSRGLELSDEKTTISHIENGFDFLGLTFRKFRGKLIIKLSKSSIKSMIQKCSEIILKSGKASKQADVIRRLNLIIKGWTNYHRHTVASKAFSYVNNTISLSLRQWAQHRHPQKNSWWRLNKYWHESNGKPWTFITDSFILINLRLIKIVRRPKLQIATNPFLDRDYYSARKIKLRMLVAA